MIIYRKIVPVIMVALLLQGCFWNSSSDQKKASLYVVNVLSSDLYDDAHIAGSIHVDLDDLDTYAAQWDKNTPVVFYCSNYQCSASAYAAKQFKKAGFTKVYAYEGGTAEWYQLGKKDPSYILKGPATESYLDQEFEKPEDTEHDVDIISAADLKKLINSAGLA